MELFIWYEIVDHLWYLFYQVKSGNCSTVAYFFVLESNFGIMFRDGHCFYLTVYFNTLLIIHVIEMQLMVGTGVRKWVCPISFSVAHYKCNLRFRKWFSIGFSLLSSLSYVSVKVLIVTLWYTSCEIYVLQKLMMLYSNQKLSFLVFVKGFFIRYTDIFSYLFFIELKFFFS